MAGTEDALNIDSVSFVYSGKLKALDKVTFDVPKGRFTALLGPNGAGKTTLFSLMTRLLSNTEGVISVGGKNIDADPRAALSGLGIVFQQPTLDLDLSVIQNLRYFAALRGLSSQLAGQRIDEELERFNMSDRRDEKVRRLNGGHRRRVEIARALLHRPGFLLLDEATVGLDIPTRQKIVDYVHALSRDEGIGVLWATHLIDEVHIEDNVIVLHRGQIVEKGSGDDILKATAAVSLSEAFNTLTGESGLS